MALRRLIFCFATTFCLSGSLVVMLEREREGGGQRVTDRQTNKQIDRERNKQTDRLKQGDREAV